MTCNASMVCVDGALLVVRASGFFADEGGAVTGISSMTARSWENWASGRSISAEGRVTCERSSVSGLFLDSADVVDTYRSQSLFNFRGPDLHQLFDIGHAFSIVHRRRRLVRMQVSDVLYP